MSDFHTPVTFFTNDGVERRFSLSNAKVLKATKDGGSSAVLWLYIMCDDKDGLGQDEFFDLMPINDEELITGLMQAIKDEYDAKQKPDPRNDKYRPRKPESETPGSGSQPTT